MEVLLADVALGDGRPIIDKPVVSAVLDETGVLNMTAVTAGEERGGEGEQCNTELSRFLLKVKTGSKNYWCRGGGGGV